jgi:D-alanyl-D-alanine carboxypeptidase
MRTSLLKWVTALLIASTAVPVHQTANATESDIGARLQAALEEGVSNGLPGISAAVVGSDGVIWSGVAGFSDTQRKIPIRKDLLFGVGSITKTFVAVVCFQLAEEGRLDLSATAMDILGRDAVGDIPNTDSATILQLMNHTGGVPTWEFDPEWIPDGRGSNAEPGKVWARDETLKYLRDGDNPATNRPGAAFNYANTNYTLLGLIVEKVTGNDLTDEIRERILAPLSIQDVYLDGFQPVPRDRLAGNYHFATPAYIEAAGINTAFETIRPGLIETTGFNLSVEWAAGGIVAAAEDLAIFAQALAAGNLLDERSRSMFLDFRPASEDEGSMEVGRGIFRMPVRENGANMINHGGGVLGYSAFMGWVENTEISVVVLINVGTMHSSPMGDKEYSPGNFIKTTEFLPLIEALASSPD